MRLRIRFLLAVLLLVTAAGPLLAAPIGIRADRTISAPAGAPGTAHAVLELLAYGVAGFLAIRIKDTATLSKKYVRNAGAAANDYKAGVEGAGQDWAARTGAAGDNYAAGVQAAIGRKAFERGVNEAGSAKYVLRATTLGAQRYPTGVGAAEGDWAKGSQPYLDALKSMELPVRRPKGDPGNQARSQAVAQKLRAQKVGG